MQRSGFAKTIGIVVIVLALIGVFLYEALQPRGGWPDESRRVVHPGGFSIVVPIGWEQHIAFGVPGQSPDVMKFLPKEAIGSPGFMSIAQLLTPATEASLKAKDYSATTFQDQPAWEHVVNHEFTKEHTRSLVFERNGRWFDLSLRRPSLELFETGVWKAYIDSFRIEPVRTLPTGSSTLPISIMPTTATTAP